MKPITLERQSDLMPEFKLYTENARFEKNGVLFVTAHIVGSNNNFEPRDPKAIEPLFARRLQHKASRIGPTCGGTTASPANWRPSTT